MRLSQRTAQAGEPTELARAFERARHERADAIDLTESNPTRTGLVHPDAVYRELGDPRARTYAPDPRGLASAREAVSAYHRARGVELAPDACWLAAGTSEIYAQLLAVLCDPGDAVLVPRPGYPLLDDIASLAGVRLAGYPLAYDGRWRIDLAELRAAIETEHPRAIVAVAPNNPTGNYLASGELAAIEALCTESDCTLVVDEVFADYPIAPRPHAVRHVAGPLRCATVVLSGLSKVAALPQMKLAWACWHGPVDDAHDLFARIEHVSDTYLSLATPVQLAAPDLLRAADDIQPRILERLRTNLDQARVLTRGTALDVLDVEGGWTALLRLPRLGGRDDATWALELCERAGVLVQPGYFFDLEGPPCVAVSLLVEPESFTTGLERIVLSTRG